MHTYTPENRIFDGLIANLLSILSILIEDLSRAHVKGAQRLKHFEFGTFTGGERVKDRKQRGQGGGWLWGGGGGGRREGHKSPGPPPCSLSFDF